MTRDRRLVVLFFVLLMAYGLLVAEAGRHPRENTANEARHRHRHRHESSNGRRNRHDLVLEGPRAASWSQELDYEDDSSLSSSSSSSAVDREDRGDREEDREGEEDDYEARSYYERSYPPRGSPRMAVHGRMFESRYPARYHRGGYRGTGWYEEDDERRRGSPRYQPGRSYRLRSDSRTGHRRLGGYARNRQAEYDSEENEYDYDYEKPRVYNEDTTDGHHRAWWKNGRKHRIAASKYARKRHRSEQSEPSRRFDDWRRRSNNSAESRHSSSSSVYAKTENRRRMENPDDYDYHVDDAYDADREEEDEEEESWKESEDEEDEEEEEEEEEDEELDNDFYKSEKKPPLKTYDDIIKWLTSEDPTTPRPTVKRDYRNIEVDRYTKRDGYGNFKYEPRNYTRPVIHERGKNVVGSAYVNAAASGSRQSSPRKLSAENLPGKLLGSLIERKSPKSVGNPAARNKAGGAKAEDNQPKTKSLEQDYDEYVNAPDNEKEEDLAKAGVDEDTGMQADVTNSNYAEEEEEEETPATSSSSTTTSTTTTTTTTTTTSTTPRPAITQNYDYRDPRAYEGGSGAQYNGYQSRSDYPPMSAHSVHKWQSLGTREGVKETRSSMQQYNKNGKTAEIREALQHAIKVSREGSCQWPRPRVIPVREVYPSPSTTYVPHCAILHRCSDDTGCCRSEALTCVPKHSNRVELSFYTTNVGGGSVVEKLSFYNHTECECRERSEYDTSNEKPSEQRVYRHHQSSPQPQNMRRAQPRKPCRCPSEFTPRITSDGECYCNCYETHQNCIKIKRGKGYFSLADRLCIQNEECATPSCEFGEYMRRQGKCPRKKDKFDAIANYHTNMNHRYRS